MKYVLTTEKNNLGATVVQFSIEFDSGEKGTRTFMCLENEAMHFTVVNGELLFVSHSRLPPSVGGGFVNGLSIG